METAAYFREKARQCRRLFWALADEPAITVLTALAREFEAKAREAEESDLTIDHPGDDVIA